jgi:hypothetical protein
MKKILMIAIILIASVSTYSQKIYTTTKKGSSVDKMETYVASVLVSDSTVQIQDKTSVSKYKITKKTVFEKQNLYRLSDGLSEYRIELYINEELGHMEFTVGMDRFEGFQVISKKVYSLSETIPQTSENSEKFTRSFGGVIGYSTFMGEISLASVSYGGYIDFGRVGLEYHNSASMNMNSADAYINGQSDKYVGGGGTMNLGFFSKFKPQDKGTLYLGLGVQSYEEISVENVNQVVFSTWYNPMTRRNETISQTVSKPQVTQDKKILPYVTIGTLQKLGDNFTFKAGLILSECSMINIGVGYNF